jgi:UDP-glucuronate 4-epimerase
MTDYYDVMLKERRLALLRQHRGFSFRRFMLLDEAAVAGLFAELRPRMVFHLGAQAGGFAIRSNSHGHIS